MQPTGPGRILTRRAAPIPDGTEVRIPAVQTAPSPVRLPVADSVLC